MNFSIASRFLGLLAASAAFSVVLLSASPAAASCGDGVFDDGEQCDTGNSVEGDCCDAECQFDGAGAACDDDGNQCTIDTCDGEGTCNHDIRQGSCNDGNDCSFGDFCNTDGYCTPGEGFAENGSACTDPGLCGGRGVCGDGLCLGDPVDCDGFGSACFTAACDVETGNCVVTPADDGTICGEGNNCTELRCSSNECIPQPKDCSRVADACHDAACDLEVPGGCYAVEKEFGTPCDDDNPCTIEDSCAYGECGGSTKDCSAAGGPCAAGVCDPQTGACVAESFEDGTTCDDGDRCTSDDACSNGQCGGTGVDCSQFDSACTVGVCDAETGECAAVNRGNGTPCDDGNNCTVADECTTGQCGGTPTDCSQFDSNCTTGVCDAETGACGAENFEDGTTCSDGNNCTVADQCTGGQCGGSPKDCSQFDSNCTTGVCDAETGNCGAENLEDGTTCSDGNSCTVADQCTSGSCGGAPKDCTQFDSNCSTGVCNPDTGNCGAENFEDGTTCSDGNNCTVADQCTSGSCGGAPKDCSQFDSNCSTGVCNPDTGDCGAENFEDGTTCNDSNGCTVADQCSGGACGGAPRDCTQFDTNCTTGVCNPDTGNCGAENFEDGTTCDDGDHCTVADQCSGGECGGSAKDCSSANGPCAIGVCSPGPGGECIAETVGDGTTCDDGNICTTGDKCTGGACAGAAVDCTNLNGPCAGGVCNPQTGECEAETFEDGTTCNDGNLCTTSDQCTTGACGGTALDCSGLGGACTTGACNAHSGLCEALPITNGTPCNDGAFCTQTDTCVNGTCTGSGNPCSGPLVCSATCNEAADSCNAPAGTACTSDGNPCTADTCDGAGGCGTIDDNATCDDGLFCTSDDHCSDGECVGSPTCPPTGACVDTCDETDNACRTCGHPFSNSRCVVNAVVILRGAVEVGPCELCTCDVDSSGTVTATDALKILRTCVNLPSVLECPDPGASTTTTLGP